MDQYRKTPAQEEQMIEDAFNDVLNGYLASNHRKKVEMIERAFRFAKAAHAGVRRRSGEPYILHPIAVAKIASQEMGLGSTSICAAFLHDVVEDTDYTVEDIRRQFGAKIAQLVEGLTKISGGIFGDKASLQAENYRKLLLTMSEDIRVVLIKMADRLHNMRTLGSMTPAKQYKIAGETLYIYAPLAHRLGLFAIKTELEDLAFRYEHPTAWEEITRKIKESSARRTEVYSDFSAPIKAKLDELGLVYDAKARLKSCYSIWKKMETKQVPFEEVYDLYAMRIVFDCDDRAQEKTLCWNIYSAITDVYRLHPERTRDWISVPKANGYQALHLTVMGPDGNWIEVQIRSRRMDEIAEKGFAAHWKYKVGEGEEESELTTWLRTIKDILDNPEPSAIDFLDTLQLNLFAAEIVVFTPKGELITLPAGSTLLDFAFALHTELGLHCIAGKVNHKLVPLNHVLSSGDQVEVITSNTQEPNPQWIEFLKTGRAKTRLRQALRKARLPMVARGRELLNDFFDRFGLIQDNNNLTKLMGHYEAANRDDLAFKVGVGDIILDDDDASALRGTAASERRLFSKFLKATRNVLTLNTGKKDDSDDIGANQHENTDKPKINTKETYTLRYDENGANFKIADCCQPIPGDDVLGFVDDSGDVVVHALNCPRALVLKAGYGPRIVSTRWAIADAKYPAHVRIEGIDRPGILQEICGIISTEMAIDMRRIEAEAEAEVFNCDLWVRVEDVGIVNDLCKALTKVEGVDRATRVQ